MSEKTVAPAHACVEDALVSDIIRGAPAIGAFIGETEHRVYYLARRGLIPVGKLGNLLIGSKQRLREHYARLTSGTAA